MQSSRNSSHCACRAVPVLPDAFPPGHEQGRTAFLLTHCTQRLLQQRRYTFIGAGALASVLPSRWPDGTPLHLIVNAPSRGAFGVFRVIDEDRIDCSACRARFARLGQAIDHCRCEDGRGRGLAELHVFGVSESLTALAHRVRELLDIEHTWQWGRAAPSSATGRPPLPLDARVHKIKTALRRYDEFKRSLPAPVARVPVTQETCAMVEALRRERQTPPKPQMSEAPRGCDGNFVAAVQKGRDTYDARHLHRLWHVRRVQRQDDVVSERVDHGRRCQVRELSPVVRIRRRQV